jgi:hypothetical protein
MLSNAFCDGSRRGLRNEDIPTGYADQLSNRRLPGQMDVDEKITSGLATRTDLNAESEPDWRL